MANTEECPIMGAFEKKMLKETLKYAAGRQISCPGCGVILDWRTVVLVTAKSNEGTGSLILCKECYKPENVELLKEEGYTVEVDKWD